MKTFKVKIKRVTYEGIKWNSAIVHAEDAEQAFRIVERDYKLYECMDYWVNIHSDIWMDKAE